ncbi:hypothetical protein AB0I06_24315 [Streptomyces sp. NPDC050674]|uniref:hypothetical protein n=1 Tax=Streptomyces sp. NPDC050674 TaxID=3157216 RepID=UPI003419E1D0
MSSFSLAVPESWWEFDIRPEGRDTTIRVRAIAESLRTITPRREGDAWRKVTTVEIPEVGTAARTYGVEDVPVAEGDTRTLRMVLTQTYVPLPGTDNQDITQQLDALASMSDAVVREFKKLDDELAKKVNDAVKTEDKRGRKGGKGGTGRE